mgnify:CR=1 FL=1
MPNKKERYADRYTTITVRFKPQEYDDFMDMYRAVTQAAGIDISKHMFIKSLIREGMLYSKVIVGT